METKSGMERMFEEAMADGDKRRAANIAFALAGAYDRTGKQDEARRWGQQSVDLFQAIETDTLEEAAPVFQTLGGTSFPNLIHEGVVAKRLSHLGLARKTGWKRFLAWSGRSIMRRLTATRSA